MSCCEALYGLNTYERRKTTSDSAEYNKLIFSHLEIMMSTKGPTLPSFSCRVHSVTPDCGSETGGGASWDVQHLNQETEP